MQYTPGRFLFRASSTAGNAHIRPCGDKQVYNIVDSAPFYTSQDGEGIDRVSVYVWAEGSASCVLEAQNPSS